MRSRREIRDLLDRVRSGHTSPEDERLGHAYRFKNSDGAEVRIGFVHIRKAAGTSFDQALRTFFLPDELLADEWMRLPVDLWPVDEIGEARYAKCHTTVSEMRRVMPDAALVTMLRNPADRLLSHHFHLRRENIPGPVMAAMSQFPEVLEAVEMANRLEFEEWVLRQASHGDALLPDLQVRALAGDEEGLRRLLKSPEEIACEDGEAMLDRALHVLEREVAFFGIAEEFDRSMRLMEVTFGLPANCVASESLNRSELRPRASRLELAEALKGATGLDLDLYRAARRIFDERCEAAGVDEVDDRMPGGVLFVSVPKAGTHLVLRALSGLGLPRAADDLDRLVRRRRGAPERRGDIALSRFRDVSGAPATASVSAPPALVGKVLGACGVGHFGQVHAAWSAELEELVCDVGMRLVLGVRDPRATLLSTAEWLVDEEGEHPLREALKDATLDERVEFMLDPSIRPQFPQVSFVEQFRKIALWRHTPGVLIVRYEDLVLEEGRRATLAGLAEHLGIWALDDEIAQIAGSLLGATRTLRHGQINRWREALRPEHVARVESELEDEMTDMGYCRYSPIDQSADLGSP